MLDTPLQQLVAQHWRSALLASASVMLSACVATDNSSSSAVEVSSEAAVSSSSEVVVPSSSVAPSSSSVESSSSQAVVVSSSSAAVSSSEEACEEPNGGQFASGETLFEGCIACHGVPTADGKTAGGLGGPIDVADVGGDLYGKTNSPTLAGYIESAMSQHFNMCDASDASCAADVAYYLNVATGLIAVAQVCESSSSEAEQSSSIEASSSSAAPVGMSLLSSPGTFANGGEGFNVIPSASFGGEVSFSIPSANTAEPWAVQMTHELSVTAGEQYVICFDAKTTASAGMRSLTVGFDNNATGGYANISGGHIDEILTAQYQNFSPVVTADATAADARLYFNLAAEAGDVQLDNIAVYQGGSCGGVVEGSSSSAVTSSSAPAVSSSSQATTSSASNPGNGNLIINDDFEGQSNNTAPSGWKTFLQYQIDPQGNSAGASTFALIDSSKAHSGSNSVRIKTGGTSIQPSFIFQDLPSGQDAFYSRFWMNIPVALGGGVKGGDGNHVHFMAYSTEMSGSNKQELRFGTLQDAILGAFLPKGIDAGTENIVPTATIPANQWVCLEFAVVKNSMFDQVYAWVDGQVILEAVSPSAWARDPGQFFSTVSADSKIDNHVSFGWRSFGDNKGVENVWFDDIAVSTEGRVGCN
ncbi:hypothetical protein [Marinagarivorans cellulosilyticus]|uniref:Cytochrome c domain-containing protein n=1 Tax=Marinagarivorans cellulosilyticus TaxID=2721545 RepID=A0AAN2BJX6_9GAMM|nr:hypothetical protein [Marinagarivorans cellulosilyticus]BCD97473.1 hypothetical protein MARGE09_P1674 [Marinagarivorans cellulosilyticus]